MKGAGVCKGLIIGGLRVNKKEASIRGVLDHTSVSQNMGMYQPIPEPLSISS